MKYLVYLRRSFVVFAGLAILLIGYSLPRITFENDILALFPQAQQTPGVAQADALLAERVTRKVFFLLHSSDGAAARAAVPGFIQTLQACACFSVVKASLDSGPMIDLQTHYTDFTPLLLGAVEREQLQAGQGERFLQRTLRDLLSNPTAGMADRLRDDPFGTLAAFLAQARPQQRNLSLDDAGHLVFGGDDKPYLFVYAELTESPYSIAVQQQAQTAIAAAEKMFATLPDSDVIKTGALFYTLAGTAQAQAEISTVGLGSALGILLLLILVFRSIWLMLLAFVPIVFGILLGLVACFWLFGSVHVVALVFGASLVGVAIDYVLHFFTRRHAMAGDWTPAAGLSHLLPALSLGLASSVAAYLSFTLAGFPGFTQVAVFSSVGLITAYLVVVGLYPWLLQGPARRPLPQRLVSLVKAYRTGLLARLHYVYSVPGLAILALVIGSGLWQLKAQDDVRTMQSLEPGVRAMDARFQSLVGQRTALQYLLVSAADPEALLQKLEELQPPLARLQQEGVLAGYQSLADYLPTQARQQANWQLWQTELIASGQLATLWEQLGVTSDFSRRVTEKFSTAPTVFLTLENTAPLLARLPDAPIHFVVEGQAYAVVLLQGLTDPQALADLAQTLEGVLAVDAVASTNQLLHDYREGTAVLLALAYLVIGLMFSWRYSWRGSLAIVAPPLLATALCLALLGWMGHSVSVFNLMALLLVLGIGIDAALFMRESAGRSYDTLLAIGLSTLTTLLAFGLLSLSATAAIHSFGLTILMGIIFCFVLSPLAAIRDAGAVSADVKNQAS